MPLPGSTVNKIRPHTGIENVTYMKIVHLKVNKTGACKSPIKVGHNHDRHEYNNQVPLPPSSPPHFHPFRCPFCRFFKNISQPRIPLLFTTAMSKVVHRSFSLWYLAVERICLFIAEKLDTWGLHSRRCTYYRPERHLWAFRGNRVGLVGSCTRTDEYFTRSFYIC